MTVVAAALSATAMGGCARSVPPDVDVVISLDNNSLRFGGNVGEVIDERAVAIEILNDPQLTWQATASVPWLHATPAAGQGPAALHVSVTTIRLAPGVYRGAIAITETNATAPPLSATLNVELTLTAPGWTALDGPYGGRVLSVAVDPTDPSWVIAADAWATTHVSSDGGDSFIRAPNAVSSDFDTMALTANGRGYAGSSDGVFRTDDRGVTWSPTSLQNMDVSQVAVDPGDADHVVGRGASLWRSTDGGSNWTEAVAESFFFVRPAPPSFADPFLLGGRNNQLLGFDGTTTTVLASLSGDELDDLALLADGTWVVAAYDPSTSAPTLFYSTDAGGSWTENDTGLPGKRFNWYDYHLAADGDDLWVASSHGVFHGSGATGLYQEVGAAYTSGSARRDDALDFILHPAGPLIGHWNDGVSRAVPGTGFVPTRMFGHWIVGIDVHEGSGTVFVANSVEGVFRWRAAEGFVGMGGPGIAQEPINGISVDPRDPQVVMIGTWGAGIRETRDGGASWRQLGAGIPTRYIGDIDRAPDDPDVLWTTAGTAGIFRSTDTGATFIQVAAGPANSIAAVSATTAITAGGTNPSLWLTASGASATVLQGGDDLRLVARTGDGSLWCGELWVGLHRSTDGGGSFVPTALSGADPQAVAVDPADPQHIFVGHDGGLLESRDDGATWTSAGAPFEVTALAVDNSSGVLYAGP